MIPGTVYKDSKMKSHFALPLLLPLALVSCAALPSLPPAEVPSAASTAYPPPPSQQAWRPYSAGPLQNQFERKSATPGTDWGRAWTTSSPRKVDRAPLPAIQPPGEARSGGSGEWSRYQERDRGALASAARSDEGSVFGSGVSSAWAAGYVPEGFRSEFAIFARKAAKDGEARMTMPSGEVYSASIIGRDGGCSTIEVTVTADGGLPVVSRGLVRSCG